MPVPRSSSRSGSKNIRFANERNGESSSSKDKKEKKADECGAFHVLGYRYGGFAKIGSGAYGVVCSAVDTQTSTKVAIKRVHPWSDDEWDARHTLRELRLMRLLSAHPNIISLLDAVLCPDDSNDLFIIMELMESDLHRIITSKQVLTCAHVSCLTAQLLLGIQAMHSVGVLHRDLKPGNLLVSRGCQLRITDFGLSRYIEPESDDLLSLRSSEEGREDDQLGSSSSSRQKKMLRRNSSRDCDAARDASDAAVVDAPKVQQPNPLTEYVVTRWYRCPEVLLAPHLPYSTAVDCWSAGCIFAELIRRKPLFQGKNFVHQVQVILERLGTPARKDFGFEPREDAARFLAKQPIHTAPGLDTLLPTATQSQLQFALRLLKFNPLRRATVDQALADDYFSDMPELPGRARDYFPRSHGQNKLARTHRKIPDASASTTTKSSNWWNGELEFEDAESFERSPEDHHPRLFSKAARNFRDATLADEGFEFGFESPETSLDELRSQIEDDVKRVERARVQRTAWAGQSSHNRSLGQDDSTNNNTADAQSLSDERLGCGSSSSERRPRTKDDLVLPRVRGSEQNTRASSSSSASSHETQRDKTRDAPARSISASETDAEHPDDDPPTADSSIARRGRRIFGLPLSLRGGGSRAKKNRVRPSVSPRGGGGASSPPGRPPRKPDSAKADPKKLPLDALHKASGPASLLSRFRSTSAR